MNILIFYKHYPVAMGRYIHWGFESAGHKVFSVGHYTRGKIPWGDGMDFPKYKYPPDLEMPDADNIPAQWVIDRVREEGFKPDILIQASDTYSLSGPADIKNVVIGTDPHAVDYTKAIKHADAFVSMQHHYLSKYPEGSLWMPYGYVGGLHVNQPQTVIKYHIVCSGLQYPHRQRALSAMAERWKVFNGLGIVYDEYVKLYNSGMIAFNWSSEEDLPARFWEGMAMKRCVLTNRVPDLKKIGFEEGVDYLGFYDMEEAISKANFYLKRQHLLFKIAENGYKKVQRHSYKHRVIKLLKDLNVED